MCIAAPRSSVRARKLTRLLPWVMISEQFLNESRGAGYVFLRGFASHPEATLQGRDAVVGHAQEVGPGSRRSPVCPVPGLPARLGVLAEFEKPGLGGKPLQSEAGKPFLKIAQEPLRLLLVMQTGADIVCIADRKIHAILFESWSRLMIETAI